MPTTSISRPSFSQHFVYFGNDEWAACPTVRAVVVGEKMSFSASAGEPPMINVNAAKPITGACRELGMESLRRYESGILKRMSHYWARSRRRACDVRSATADGS